MRLVLATLLAIGLHVAAHGQGEATREDPPASDRASAPATVLDGTGDSLAKDAIAYEAMGALDFQSKRGTPFADEAIAGSFRFMCYVNGVKHGYLYAQDLFTNGNPEIKFPQLRFPPEVTNGQQYRVIAKYLREHPEKLHLPAFVLVIEALAEAFPPETK